ncbi:MAG: DNA polymerase III subunit alpha [Planctomycetota bacterium]|jgi:DNA polymerase-3 subunit alpha
MTAFVHLRSHCHYSLLSAPARIPGLIQAAVADEQPALALTDSGNLFGAIEFYKGCSAAGIKPILGMVAFCAADSRKVASGPANPTHQLTLIASSNVGFENLKRLSSIGHLEGFHYRPRIDREALSEHREGLIVLSGDSSGEIARLLQADDVPAAARCATELQEIVGKENFYLEILETGIDAQKQINPLLLELHARMGIPIVATNDVHYLNREDWVAQDIMTCIRSGKNVSDENRLRLPSRDLYFKTAAEMAELFAKTPQALASSLEIAERCEVEIDFETYHLPVFETEDKEDPEQLFERLCVEGAKQRYGELTPSIQERLDYEIGVIRQQGFSSYFLITADFIDFARERGIPVGPGRGSAAGSIVAYSLRITDIDPLRYNLIFERFLNASRISMPDIDIDFCGNRRDEVIDYVRHKYGEDCVSQIITFGTMASRGVLRDVGRVLEVPLPEVDRIAKKVPQGPGASLVEALETDKELQAIRDESPSSKRLFEMGVKLEGVVRHSSIHAAGVVVADRPLIDYVPLCKSGEDIVTQWQMTDLEEVGLLKVDFLGLKTLTILQEACRLIREIHEVEIDIENLPLDDGPTYELMARGDTLGVFQLESSGMRDLLARLKPDKFEDVIAVLALYRPGPLGSGMADMFVRRKHGEEEIAYPHESLTEILEETYGVIVYQEQVMRIANVLAGFSMNEADSLRKAMGKKKPEVMAKFKEQFVDGAANGGHNRNASRDLFETIEYFAGYGFNKSHSAAYALITYQTAWLKAHYPLEFIAANMTVESGNSDKLKEFIDELRRKEIPIRPPDVNASQAYFNVEEGELRYGLGAIKGVGSKVAEFIPERRRQGEPYRALEDLCETVDQTLLNKTALEALICAGALDSIEPSRKASMSGIEAALRSSAVAREDRRKGQGSLFAMMPEPADTNGSEDQPAAETEDWGELERLSNEKQALGFYLSGHPFHRRGAFLARIAGQDSRDLQDLGEGDEIRIAGMISAVRPITVRKGRNAGKKMARFQLEDLHGTVAATVFTRAYEEMREQVVDDAIVLIRGRRDSSGEETAMIVDEVKSGEHVVASEVHGLVLHLDPKEIDERTLDAIEVSTGKHRGEHRLLFEMAEEDRTYRVRAGSQHNVALSDDLLDELMDLVGQENLSFTRR